MNQPIMRQMKAIRINCYGGHEQMQLEDAPVPVYDANDLLVRVVAAGVNPIDWKIRAGAMAHGLPKAFAVTLGWDAAGVVDAVGGSVTTFKPGDEVCFYAEFARGGAYAEYVAVDASQVALKPRTLAFSAAAALPMAGQAAWTALVDNAQIERGMRVLIHGGAGALGSVAVQLAKDAGLHVIATASGDGVAQRLDARGPRLVTQQPFEALLRKAFLPAPDGGLRLVCLAHDLHRTKAISGEQNNPGAPYVLLWRVTVLDQSHKSPTIGG